MRGENPEYLLFPSEFGGEVGKPACLEPLLGPAVAGIGRMDCVVLMQFLANQNISPRSECGGHFDDQPLSLS